MDTNYLVPGLTCDAPEAYYQGSWGYIHEESIERDLKKDFTEDNSAAG